MTKQQAKQLDPFKFKPGQSGNPNGRPVLSSKIRAFRETSYEDFIESLKYYGSLTESEMKADLARADSTMFDKIFGTMVAQASTGDEKARSELLNRLWGKPKENIDMAGIIQAKLAMLSNEELIKLAKDSVKKLEGAKDE